MQIMDLVVLAFGWIFYGTDNLGFALNKELLILELNISLIIPSIVQNGEPVCLVLFTSASGSIIPNIWIRWSHFGSGVNITAANGKLEWTASSGAPFVIIGRTIT